MTTATPIEAFRITPHSVPIHVPFAIATETLPTAQILTFQVVDAEGRQGLGEASPFPSLTYDDTARAETLLRELGSLLCERSAAAGLTFLEENAAPLQARSITAYVAAETALRDLLARQWQMPMALMFGTSLRSSCETDITLPILPAAGIDHFWELFRSHGFRTIKIKVRGHVDDDVAAVRHLQRLTGDQMSITLDGNQGFSVASALQLMETLHRHGIRPAFFEQPLPRDDHQGSRQLTERSPLPICLDESVCTAADAITAVQEKRGHMLNIKIMKSGIAEALRIIHIAQAARWPLMIGGMLESEIAMATSLHLAAGTGAIRHFDLDTPFFFTRSLTQAHPWQARQAHLQVPYGVGHGLQALSAG